jgi:hypothetical protein
MTPTPDERSLASLRADFGKSRMLAMPIAGTLAWLATAFFGAVLSLEGACYALFICTGSVFPLGLLIARFTGEDLLGSQSNNPLDRLFGLTVLMANLSWGIAIPFWLVEPTSLPLSAGILAGTMWIPLSWLIQHPVGFVHAILRTVLVLITWIALPEHRFVAVPLVIVLVYLISIGMLVQRIRTLDRS